MEGLSLCEVKKYMHNVCIKTKGERDTIKKHNKVEEVYLRFDLWWINNKDNK
jgi:hypothetical protein